MVEDEEDVKNLSQTSVLSLEWHFLRFFLRLGKTLIANYYGIRNSFSRLPFIRCRLSFWVGRKKIITLSSYFSSRKKKAIKKWTWQITGLSSNPFWHISNLSLESSTFSGLVSTGSEKQTPTKQLWSLSHFHFQKKGGFSAPNLFKKQTALYF